MAAPLAEALTRLPGLRRCSSPVARLEQMDLVVGISADHGLWPQAAVHIYMSLLYDSVAFAQIALTANWAQGPFFEGIRILLWP